MPVTASGSRISLGLRTSTMTLLLAQLKGKRKYQVHARTFAKALPPVARGGPMRRTSSVESEATGAEPGRAQSRGQVGPVGAILSSDGS